MRIRLRFKHGIGDAVQFGIVLRHLRASYPDCHLILESTNKRDALFRHLVDELLPLQYPFNLWDADINKDVLYPRLQKIRSDLPTTKATECVCECFGLEPKPELWRYTISVKPEAQQAAIDWYESLPEGPAVLIHYEGQNYPERKNLPRELIERACARLIAAGLVPVILDWRFSKVANGQTIFQPAKLPLDCDHVAALIEEATAFLGIDSGPEHIAAATSTPTYVFWKDHFPGNHFDPAPNVKHWIGDRAVADCRGMEAWDYFEGHYHWQHCAELGGAVMAQVEEIIEACQ